MPQVRFVLLNGDIRTVDSEIGEKILDVAMKVGIPGIVGDCGGELSCGTCHGIFKDADLALMPRPSADEAAMIEDGVANPEPGSRLCCQVYLPVGIDQLIVTIPKQF